MLKTIIQYIVSAKKKRAAKRKYEKDKKNYIEQSGNEILFRYNDCNQLKILNEFTQSAGHIDEHYFFQDIYAAKFVLTQGWKHIYDIGSRVDGYISHLLAGGVNVTMIDIRPLDTNVDGLSFIQANATDLSGINDNSIPTLSCLHALEHFGLGRYGDPVDYNGWKKALHTFTTKITYGGTLILSVPCGKTDKLIFNAHRIFNPLTIFNELSSSMRLTSFALIHNCTTKQLLFNDTNNVYSEINKISKTLGDYDCGIFIFQKKSRMNDDS